MGAICKIRVFGPSHSLSREDPPTDDIRIRKPLSSRAPTSGCRQRVALPEANLRALQITSQPVPPQYLVRASGSLALARMGAFDRALEHGELLAEHEFLERELTARLQVRKRRPDEREQEIDHRRRQVSVRNRQRLWQQRGSEDAQVAIGMPTSPRAGPTRQPILAVLCSDERRSAY